ncbi:hypothetical protein BKI52_23755 [marine bacterium AO1-C]|nr:hypothetical protein BKI52_23755 [marine bacterium AO1-C]
MNYPHVFRAFQAFLLLGVMLGLLSCNRTNEEVIPTGPQQLEFPNCELLKVENAISSGSLQSYRYVYENGRLVQTDFYNKNEFNSRKTFTYDTQGNLAYMLGQNDTLSSTKDTIAAYEFKDGLLSKYIHFDPFNKIVLTITEYTYENGFLKNMRVINNEQGRDKAVDFQVENDERGNPIKVTLVSVDGAPPPISLERFYEYDDKFNPYYKTPDFIELQYFAQNNVIKTTEVLNGQTNIESTTYEYYTHGLIEKRSFQTSQGEFVSSFTYNCK